MGTIRMMTPAAGDEEIQWDPEDESSVKTAKNKFEELKGKGFKLFKGVKEEITRKGEEAKEFDPAEKQYIAVPAMAGG